ncbi:tyrosine-type recombinase/integrase [Shewanella xiamenensis]|jgi:integrase|uniref:Tyrosine-type recombinase/integrase n=5 Tax=Alteromonadales TaxID=135622 RepID=A0A8J6M056_9ALTE|nr:MULTISPECIES: tyrosine-type recombinase/integrase [Gammaproteobacteria]MAR91061.1 integrase [Pseudomonadales bacterium]MBU0538744.1 tyrosine-type recombinase/integrase [Gammaproteobacteria bacterium]MCP3863708.1 tyrosine-type recombinase/integrase [Aestuariibacter sp.]MEC8810088.1 tyrosine-type recombinase/integrase [Pseudomonadota bacterium]PZP34958.1 MAG: integrase [Shewanella oneidensis]CAD6364514.1 Tyrosine recombinase XerC [Shewanella hafniensis]|tara:strand:+ start:351 stop:1364 length:1014 start_codon:yes stop_codon:yes gene_type:complete
MNNKPPKPASNLPLRNEESTLIERQEAESLRHYLQAATSDNTRKAYRSAIRQFEKWGGRLPSDRDTVVRYLLARAESLNPRTLDLHLTAISQWHHYQGLIDPVSDPLVRKTMEGVRRTQGQPKRKAKALRLEHIAQMVNHLRQLPDTKKKQRDIALVLTGFFGAFRRSELVAIQIGDLVWEPEGLLIRLSRSKTDQQAMGLVRALPFGAPGCCPAMAMKNWIELADINEGPVFRPVNRWDKVQPKALNPGGINQLLKTLGNACQFDFVPDLSSHSFRRGLSTSAAREKIDFEFIKKQGGWKSDATVWEYIEEGQQFTNNASFILLEKLQALIDSQLQ